MKGLPWLQCLIVLFLIASGAHPEQSQDEEEEEVTSRDTKENTKLICRGENGSLSSKKKNTGNPVAALHQLRRLWTHLWGRLVPSTGSVGSATRTATTGPCFFREENNEVEYNQQRHSDCKLLDSAPSQQQRQSIELEEEDPHHVVALYTSASAQERRAKSIVATTPTWLEQQQQQFATTSFLEPHAGMILTVYQNSDDDNSHHDEYEDGSCSNAPTTTTTTTTTKNIDVMYELGEPVDLELGLAVLHAIDYAYMPPLVVDASSSVEGIQFIAIGGGVDGSFATTTTTTTTPTPSSSSFSTTDHEEGALLSFKQVKTPEQWWQWWLPWWNWNGREDHSDHYRMQDHAFAGGSHGQVWRGRRRCSSTSSSSSSSSSSASGKHPRCNEPLILKRLKIEKGYRVLEAGLREVYFGSWLAERSETEAAMYTRYLDHFFREPDGGDAGLELWIVFKDAGRSLRSFLYSAAMVGGDYLVYQNSLLWVQLRQAISHKKIDHAEDLSLLPVLHGGGGSGGGTGAEAASDNTSADANATSGEDTGTSGSSEKVYYQMSVQKELSQLARQLMRAVLRQIIEAAALLHANGIVHRDIKPSNVLCQTSGNFTLNSTLRAFGSRNEETLPKVHCVLGDFSSASNEFTLRNLYTRGPSRQEQTDEYAPPETMFVHAYNGDLLTPAFDSWSIGIVALELLLGTPKVFGVDQRTRAVLSHRMKNEGASDADIEKAMYLAALSQFCIYNPSKDNTPAWPLRHGDPLHKSRMTKASCTLNDFHQALRTRDPLGWGFTSEDDPLLHLIWQLLAWDPEERITAEAALRHHYFASSNVAVEMDAAANERYALESMMLDPRFDFNISDSVDEFTCPHCGRTFGEWRSCQKHATARKHAKFCTYEKSSLPTCLNAHAMLPAHPFSGYCDIQGRRSGMEDFHAIHLRRDHQFYAIFDGHHGNMASKFVGRYLYKDLAPRLMDILGSQMEADGLDWKQKVAEAATASVEAVHARFLDAIDQSSHAVMSRSGTTATAAFVTDQAVVIVSLGDSRAVLSTRRSQDKDGHTGALQLTKDHVASDPEERKLVESRGGFVERANGLDRVNGTLAITRSIGDAYLSSMLSRTPQVISKTRSELIEDCWGSAKNEDDLSPCFVILASDGLWDTMSNQEAVDMVVQVLEQSNKNASASGWRDMGGLQAAAEALTLEAYVRGSTDNIGVCVVALV